MLCACVAKSRVRASRSSDSADLQPLRHPSSEGALRSQAGFSGGSQLLRKRSDLATRIAGSRAQQLESVRKRQLESLGEDADRCTPTRRSERSASSRGRSTRESSSSSDQSLHLGLHLRSQRMPVGPVERARHGSLRAVCDRCGRGLAPCSRGTAFETSPPRPTIASFPPASFPPTLWLTQQIIC